MEAYIVKAYRTAVGKAKKGGFKHFRSDDLGIRVIQHIMKNTPELEAKLIDGVLTGCAVPEGEQGLQIGRLVALRALGIDTPGVTVNRYCGSGLETIAMAVAKIRAGMGQCYLAGGIESMSLLPMTGYKFAPNYELGLHTPDYMVSMGITAEALAEKYHISREEQDTFSLNSHKKAAKAIDNGHFKDQIVPIEVTEKIYADGELHEKTFVVDTDEGVRRSTTLEALARLRPVFKQNGTVTAGNSSQTSDGASYVLVMSESLMNSLGLSPIARLVTCATAGVEPYYMGIGPVKAIPKALKWAGMKLSDIDLIELNEAFASQSLAVIREAKLDPEIVNINGGAIALGHPLGCTGAKLTTQILNDLKRRGEKYGMVTACIGGGQGIAGIFERL